MKNDKSEALHASRPEVSVDTMLGVSTHTPYVYFFRNPSQALTAFESGLNGYRCLDRNRPTQLKGVSIGTGLSG